MTEAWLEPLSQEQCLRLLRRETVGRIAVVTTDGPIILPVNYRVVERGKGALLALRTRLGNVIEQADTNVAFEIDSTDPVHQQGWSVLVRGELVHTPTGSAALEGRYDSEPWLTDRDAWLLIDPWAISGRELHGSQPVWTFPPGEYV